MCCRRAFSSYGAHGGPALWLAKSLWPWKPSHGWTIPPLNMTWGKDRKQGHLSHTHIQSNTFWPVLRTHVSCWWCNQGVCHCAHGRITEGELEVNGKEKQITWKWKSARAACFSDSFLELCSWFTLAVKRVSLSEILNKTILFFKTCFVFGHFFCHKHRLSQMLIQYQRFNK